MAKIRTGFVSNSSSSSFVVSGKPGEKLTLIKTITLNDYVETIIETLENLNEWFSDEFGYEDIETLFDSEDVFYQNLYLKCKKELEDGNSIYVGLVTNDSDSEQASLYENGFSGANKNFKILRIYEN